jgi:hypothetical protein
MKIEDMISTAAKFRVQVLRTAKTNELDVRCVAHFNGMSRNGMK